MKNRALILSAAALSIAAPAMAWNGRGHMIVAAKAWDHLSPSARANAGRLLRHNPMYARWIAGVPAADRDRVAFIHAATWPDNIKARNSGYTPDHITGPNAHRNTGYDDCQQHRFWHYKDLPFSPDATPLEPPPAPNAETQIDAFSTVLADPHAGDERKAYDLVWLIHLVGDVHQPLHATSRFVAAHPGGDGGGNDVNVCLLSACSTGSPLHTYWDHVLGDSEAIASVTAFARGLPSPAAAKAAVTTPAAWLAESFALAQSDVYRAPIGNTLGPFTLTAAYRANALALARSRVSLAGVRLANLIEGAHLHLAGDPVHARTCVAGHSH